MKHREFENDPMMKELHGAREKFYRETKHLSSEERIKLTREYVRKGLEELGYILVPSERKGTYKIAPSKSKEGK